VETIGYSARLVPINLVSTALYDWISIFGLAISRFFSQSSPMVPISLKFVSRPLLGGAESGCARQPAGNIERPDCRKRAASTNSDLTPAASPKTHDADAIFSAPP